MLIPNVVSRHSCLLSQQSFSDIFSSLCRDRVEKWLDKVPLPFNLINVMTELSFVSIKFLSFDFLYVSTLTSLSQHFSINLSHIMSQQSCEMSRQSSFLA